LTEKTEKFFQGLAGRRRKAALLLVTLWLTIILLHLVSWGGWLVMGFSSLLWMHITRLVLAKPKAIVAVQEAVELPSVSLLVAAKNEEAVIARLVHSLCQQDYPADALEVLVVDDYSTDNTPKVLAELQVVYPQLKVFRRGPEASGGKSGALNQILPKTRGEIIAVFDADATVTADLLQRVIPVFGVERIGAVQVRKAIANSQVNFLTKGQMTEMALDSYLQQQRFAIGGITELRGNGQFVRRSALKSCGGWNEQTITDDLDLTIRLHLDQWDIGFVFNPAVGEEGVTTLKSLWHQRNRWAEGGYQRYLDYWRLIIRHPLGWRKSADLLTFLITQYLLPTAMVPDTLMSVWLHRLPLLTPLSILTISLPIWGTFTGLRRLRPDDRLTLPLMLELIGQTLRGVLYLFHWIPLMASVTARVSVRQKRLKWVKTVHRGD